MKYERMWRKLEYELQHIAIWGAPLDARVVMRYMDFIQEIESHRQDAAQETETVIAEVGGGGK